MLVAKKLRVAVAGITDVGRRRERNQDNVTHIVPTEEDVLAAKGALFVVCDGMGGHAAGEVASELGVNSIRDVYYASQETDIIKAFAHAIKEANQAIYTYAREHVEMTGMGTTCVALVVHGGRAYFINIGDSRGYIMRNGKLRQVTQDHSWVAEQMRAGLLTEEQARTHAHRNVITRSLGTQPTVNADLFVETLREGDRVLLCSDGLHGYVEERAIEAEMGGHQEPESGARNLIDMANASGGPDNITALVVHMLDVPEAVGDLTIPLSSDDPEQTITQPMPAIRKPDAVKAGGMAGHPTAQKAGHASGSRAALIAVRLLAVAALLLLSAGIWDVGFGPFAAARVANQQIVADLTHARQVANGSAQQSPADALSALALSQRQLLADLQSSSLDDANRASAEVFLDTQLAPAVQDAISRYNSAAAITPVSLSAVSTHSVACGAAGAQADLATPAALAAITPTGADAGTQPVFALAAGQLYQLAVPVDSSGHPTAGPAACTPMPLANSGSVLALASDGAKLYALAKQGSGGYEILTIEAIPPATEGTPPTGSVPPPTPIGSTHLTISQRFGVATPNGEVPALLAAQGDAIYVAYSTGSTGGTTSAGVWLFSGNPPKAAPQTIKLPQQAVALAAANGTVYTILADGTLGQLDPTHTYLPLTVPAQPPLVTRDPTTYVAAMPVPTVPPASTTSGTTGTPGVAGGGRFAAGATLAITQGFATHVFVADAGSNRIVRLVGSASGPGLGLARPYGQYVYGPPVAGAQQLAVASAKDAAIAYVWAGKYLVSFPLDEPTS